MWSRVSSWPRATKAGDPIPVPLVAAWSLRLESVPPVRRFGSYRGQGHLVGGVGHRWAACLIEAWLERDPMLLDFDPTVTVIAPSTFGCGE